MKRRNMFILVVALGSGCSNAPEPLPWETLPDGSKIEYSSSKGPLGAAEVIRCWPQGGAFDCVALDGRSFRRDVVRFKASSLPGSWRDFDQIGYRCWIGSAIGGYQEQVHGPHGRLATHAAIGSTADSQPGWSKSKMDAYAAKNGLKPTAEWFDCRSLTLVLDKGSNATLAAADVSLDLLDGKVAMKPAL